MQRPRFLRALTLAFALCLGGEAALSATDDAATLAPDQMRAAAGLALREGDAQRALAFADALLARDPGDLTAKLIRARALRDLGQTGPALKAARSAWAGAETKADRYAAAMVMAQVQSTAGHKSIAQLWLRRAVHLAPSPVLEKRAIRDFRYVRATNPWSTRMSFAITPDSNINNGSSSRSSFLNYKLTELLFGEPVEYELSGAALALSGIEYSFGFDTRYRFKQTATRAHDVFLSFDMREYTLSSEAKSLAPTARSSDFAFSSIFAGYGYRGINMDNRGEFAFRADVGNAWYGRKDYARYLRASFGQTYNTGPKARLSGRLAAERQFGINTADMDTVRIDLTRSRSLPSGIRYWLAATGAFTSSPTASEEFTELGLSASIALAQPVFGADLQLEVGYRNRDYDVSPHSINGRQDHRLSGEVTLIFSDVDYYGFNPTLSLYGSSTSSNISLYDADRFGVNFGIQSAF